MVAEARAMTLLERDPALDALASALAEAAAGEGRVALVYGEAGIGKTSLVDHFTRARAGSARTLWGACDSLHTPRPLGPVYDIAPQAGPALRSSPRSSRSDRLGARPDLERLRQRLRASGARHIPRGPRPATRGNPLGLTAREAGIAALLARALTNARIGERLHISPNTVDHHVSAILGKLGVASREEAGRVALQLGLGPQDGEAVKSP